ncbi:MAG: NUDIX hydrolase [Gomphosphaeria aponina SAG 52.96 = DSM 107014]|uniref:NUDIX hydrolase n=1 Tax=Gomphosphaeria aponina SAG 52.96 = DSM 107014 TaxID=1521640 RepID=A0A941GPX1_9CHRO|nr:NUDIX hydrolase [Gomphosphaeria aponina SAG 52.96 = DSM 107014]
MNQSRLRLAVVGLFVDSNEVLMLHQMTFPEPDCWDLPGGGLEPHESLLEGLQREVKEETGIENFTIEKLLTVAESFFPEGEGNFLHTVNVIYQCSVHPKPLSFSIDEMEIGAKGVQWLPIEQLNPQICSQRSWQALKVFQTGV